ncbi:MAG TPA: fused MFS/spermidine synthase [Gemmatimonadaceae bacterium]
MSSPRTRPPDGRASPAASPRYLPLLLLLFVGSGCAALIYEIVWFQLLSLNIGSSAVSLGVLLGTFMGGMCIGSLGLSRVISPRHHPLRVYAALEGAIGVLGILVLVVLPYAGGIYTAIAAHGMTGLFLRGVVSAICLLPPTLLMGATLPAIARWVETTPAGVAWLGFFYGGTTAGAVFGCLLAGFYLLRVYDIATATYVAVAINAFVAVSGYALSRVTPHAAPAEAATPEPAAPPAPGAWLVYLTIAISGATALAAEVVWTRILSLLLGATTYTFSLILAGFLVGIGLGSSIGSVIARSTANARTALGWCQALLVLGIAWAAYALTQMLPYWPVNPGLASTPRFQFEIDLLRCLWVVLPAALLWGASFPLALAGIGSGERDGGRLVGRVYAANTVGAIVGALASSLWLIAWIGTNSSERVMIAFAAASALLMFLPALSEASGTLQLSRRGAALGLGTVVVAAWLAATTKPEPDLLVAYGRWMVTYLPFDGKIIYVGEGMNSSVAVSEMPNGVRNYHNAGKVQASSEPQDMRLQRMLGHLTTLLPAHPTSVLVIGCGAGVTAGAVSIDPRVQHETIAEIEPLVPKVVSQYFAGPNFDVVNNPKVNIVIDDARHYILTTDQKFDAVTSDPLDPWVKGAATLYTEEFFNVVKQHLNPGGVVTLFVQLYESNEAAVKSEVATFMKVFPNGMVFGNEYNGGGYDMVLVGSPDPLTINVDSIEQRLETPAYAPVARSLSEIGFYSAVDLFSTFAAQGPQLAPWTADAQINHDRNLRLQYLAGMSNNQYNQQAIYADMLRYRAYPPGLFEGSPRTLQILRAAIGGGAQP